MTRLVKQPTVVLILPGTEAIELHRTMFEALAAQSPTLATLVKDGTCSTADLAADVEHMLSTEKVENAPPAWRLIQTSEHHLGPSYFAIDGKAEVASCGDTTAWVTSHGLEFTTTDHHTGPIMAVEVEESQTHLILPDGHESGTLDHDTTNLANFLCKGHTYVTAVPADFKTATERVLYRLRGRLEQTTGAEVTLI